MAWEHSIAPRRYTLRPRVVRSVKVALAFNAIAVAVNGTAYLATGGLWQLLLALLCALLFAVFLPTRGGPGLSRPPVTNSLTIVRTLYVFKRRGTGCVALLYSDNGPWQCHVELSWSTARKVAIWRFENRLQCDLAAVERFVEQTMRELGAVAYPFHTVGRVDFERRLADLGRLVEKKTE